MLQKALFIVLVFIAVSVQAQKFEISGKLLDSITQEPLEGATVFTETLKDSSLISYTITDADGVFNVSGKSTKEKINLLISFVGYEPVKKVISLPKDEDPLELKPIEMSQRIEALSDVLIEGRVPPIRIKQDTLEYNAASFKTKEGATIEDLLRELPGVEIDEDGSIKVNGIEVNRILVGGKEFFSGDGSIATKNLLKDMVDKIQVVDTRSDSQVFRGEKASGDSKTINIKLDKDKNKGVFGRVAAGGGSDERFEFAGLANYFNDDLRLSVLSGGNNINTSGFTFGELREIFNTNSYTTYNGGISIGGRRIGGGNGIVNSKITGANYADDLGKNLEVSSDYFYSASNNFFNSISSSENIRPDGNYFSENSYNNTGNQDKHEINSRIKATIDSSWMIDARPRFSYEKNFSRGNSNSESREENGDLRNTSTSSNYGLTEQTNFSNNLNINRRFNQSFLSLGMNNNISNSDFERNSESEYIFYNSDQEDIYRNQIMRGGSKNNNTGAFINFRSPIIEKLLFYGISYNYAMNLDESENLAFDFDEETNQFSSLNEDQSTSFDNRTFTHKPALNLSYQGEIFNFSIDARYSFADLESTDRIRDFSFNNDFNAFEGSARFNYRFSKTSSLRLNYNLSNQIPSIYSLTPFRNISNPLNIVEGNPDLDLTKRHNVRLSYNASNMDKQLYFNANINGDYTTDPVQSQTTIDEDLVRFTTYTNIKDEYRISGYMWLNKNFKLDSINRLGVNLNLNAGHNKNYRFTNGILYTANSQNYSVGPSVNLSNQNLRLQLSYSMNLQVAEYDLESIQDQRIYRNSLNFSGFIKFLKNFEWNNDFRYSTNPQVDQDRFDAHIFFWNSSISYKFLKNDFGLLTLKAYDILNENTNVYQYSGADSITSYETTALTQYFMLSFSYRFDTFHKNGKSHPRRRRR
ncbi:outer membrane beta-barrel protein [Zunongwangia atlantica]|uniref:TonB dependent receptor n=1 Tax=Zunongwangia atlantica 22II14-10F7 TaxID=1185767 RepID=A0A1Y1T748_9FLAO|nr:outer membrane beta-barrel protein [Zunongwangia atlantica]ORL46887.1 tonB dependent receptor [Zunongwangia atlantica 22II14-10F7]